MKKIQRFYVDVMAMHPEVTGSCNLVIVKLPDGRTIRFVVDCGLFQEKEYEELNYSLPFDGENIDFALVTHNHVDHIGRLPYMVKEGFEGKIFCTFATSKLMPLALNDSVKVLRDLAKRQNRKTPLYTESDVEKTTEKLIGCEFSSSISINENVKVTFLPNGHLIGAAVILVQVSFYGCQDINLLFTGDYNSNNMFLDIPKIPKWIRNLQLTIVCESTYGYMDSTEKEESFKKNICECVKNEGTAVVPVFSLGRSQEILYILKCMQESGELDSGIPIFLDGKLAIKYTGLYKKYGLGIKPEMQEFLPENLIFINKETRRGVLEDRDCKIILTTSGMGSYGPAQQYLPEYLERANTLIQFTGYVAEGTLGRKLKEASKGKMVELNGLLLRKRAEVEYTTEFSAHAKADELIVFLKKFKNLKLVLINHGETSVKEKFGERILDEIETKVGILGRQYFFRVNEYGLVKTLNSKFD